MHACSTNIKFSHSSTVTSAKTGIKANTNTNINNNKNTRHRRIFDSNIIIGSTSTNTSTSTSSKRRRLPNLTNNIHILNNTVKFDTESSTQHLTDDQATLSRTVVRKTREMFSLIVEQHVYFNLLVERHHLHWGS
jgi:hypothetical protein